MENIVEHLPSVNSVWAMVPMLLYILYAIWRDVAKNRKKNKKEYAEKEALDAVQKSLEEISEKTDKFQTSSLEWRESYGAKLLGVQVMQLIQSTPHNCSKVKAEMLNDAFKSYSQGGINNGIVAHQYEDWFEKREKFFKNLKQNQNK